MDGPIKPNLPTDPAAFYRAASEIDPLSPQPEAKHLLEQLGPPLFRKTSFPMMGFLATLYEHVASHV
jgi:hypothetical protein